MVQEIKVFFLPLTILLMGQFKSKIFFLNKTTSMHKVKCEEILALDNNDVERT